MKPRNSFFKHKSFSQVFFLWTLLLVLAVGCTASPATAPSGPVPAPAAQDVVPLPSPEPVSMSPPVLIPQTTPERPPVPELTPAPKPLPTSVSTPVGALPLIDAHDHITPGLMPETIVSLMDQAGVRKMVAMANRMTRNDPMGYEESLVLAVYERYPDRIIPFVTTARWGSHFRDATFLEYVERQLQTGKFKGMGEFMVKHYAVAPPHPSETATPEFSVPADSQLMQDMMRLGAKYNVPLLIHMETEPDTLAALDRALLANPNTKVIWAHQNPLKMGGGPEAQYAGQADPSQLAALLDKHPNLLADVSVGYEGVFLDPQQYRQLPESWKNLYEKYNDRFVVGLDLAYKTTFENLYVNTANWHRGWLSQLSSATAKKLAYENIERILSQAGSLTSTSLPTQAPVGTPAPPPMPAGTLPLIDVHVHLPRELTLDHLIKLMDETSVWMSVVMPVFFTRQDQGISDEDLILEFYRKKPDRIIPFLGMQRDPLGDIRNWQEPARVDRLLQLVESQLSTGLFRGMGEFILWHYAYSVPARGEEKKIPADTPLMRKFLDLAARHRVPITLHYEIDEESLPSLKSMLDYGRQVTIILAHNGGRPDPPTLKALLDEYPNLLADLGGMTYWGLYGFTSGEYRKNPIDDGTGHLRPEWKALYEQYPDRFVGIGSDFAHPENWAGLEGPERYRRQIAAFRSLLSDLSPETAEKIAYKNALRIFAPLTTP